MIVDWRFGLGLQDKLEVAFEDAEEAFLQIDPQTMGRHEIVGDVRKSVHYGVVPQ